MGLWYRKKYIKLYVIRITEAGTECRASYGNCWQSNCVVVEKVFVQRLSLCVHVYITPVSVNITKHQIVNNYTK